MKANSECRAFTRIIVQESYFRHQDNYRQAAVRSISLGTNLTPSDDDSGAVTLQAVRPWYMSDSEGSNTKADNERTMTDLFAAKTVALFGVPAPFTGTCTNEHYPGYKQLVKKFKDEGVDEIICYAVADPYAHHAWSNALGNDSTEITFLADPDASFAVKYGVDGESRGVAQAYADHSIGRLNSIRFSMLVAVGTVKSFNVVEDAIKDAETLLSDLRHYSAA